MVYDFWALYSQLSPSYSCISFVLAPSRKPLQTSYVNGPFQRSHVQKFLSVPIFPLAFEHPVHSIVSRLHTCHKNVQVSARCQVKCGPLERSAVLYNENWPWRGFQLLKFQPDLFTNNNGYWEEAKLTLHPKRPSGLHWYRYSAGFVRDGHCSRRKFFPYWY